MGSTMKLPRFGGDQLGLEVIELATGSGRDDPIPEYLSGAPASGRCDRSCRGDR